MHETIEATLQRGDALHPRRHPHQHLHARRQRRYLQAFVEQLTELNRGRAFFTTPETLGDYVLVDFIEQKRAMAGAATGGSTLGLRRRGSAVET